MIIAIRPKREFRTISSVWGQFSTAEDASVFMWGRDTARYEFSVCHETGFFGPWHPFRFTDISKISADIEALAARYAAAWKRQLSFSPALSPSRSTQLQRIIQNGI